MCNSERIDFALLPPPPFIARRMVFAVVASAERQGELFADFEPDTLRLGVTNMMGMRRAGVDSSREMNPKDRGYGLSERTKAKAADAPDVNSDPPCRRASPQVTEK